MGGRYTTEGSASGAVAVLTISSARVDLARLMNGVFVRNRIRYVRIDEQAIDTVQIECGDQSDRASFHCAQLNVLGADGNPVLPVRFNDDPFIYQDGFGLQQGVKDPGELIVRSSLSTASR